MDNKYSTIGAAALLSAAVGMGYASNVDAGRFNRKSDPVVFSYIKQNSLDGDVKIGCKDSKGNSIVGFLPNDVSKFGAELLIDPIDGNGYSWEIPNCKEFGFQFDGEKVYTTKKNQLSVVPGVGPFNGIPAILGEDMKFGKNNYAVELSGSIEDAFYLRFPPNVDFARGSYLNGEGDLCVDVKSLGRSGKGITWVNVPQRKYSLPMIVGFPSRNKGQVATICDADYKPGNDIEPVAQCPEEVTAIMGSEGDFQFATVNYDEICTAFDENGVLPVSPESVTYQGPPRTIEQEISAQGVDGQVGRTSLEVKLECPEGWVWSDFFKFCN